MENVETQLKNKVIAVTGFGPFGEHKVNASWEAVRLLNDYKIEGIEIVTKEIPVRYVDVDACVPKIWKEYQPDLVIHVGVSKYAKRLTIETKANRGGYTSPDCEYLFHPTGSACTENDDCAEITTGINVPRLLESLGNDRKFQISEDAGRYLCEYIYYKSLQIGAERTLFVHVPMLEKPFTAKELAEGLCEIIKEAVKLI